MRRWFLLHPVAMDRLVAGFYLVPAVASAFFVEAPPESSAELVLARGPVAAGLVVVALLAATALLRWRRRAPLRAAVAIGALAAATAAVFGTLNGLDLVSALVLYAVAAATRPRTAWLTLGGLLVVVGGAVLLWERATGPGAGVPDTGERVGSATGLLILHLAALAIGTGVRNRRLHVAALVDRANALAVERDQGARLAAAAERARIAREMHDVVAHSLSVMIALADGAGAAMERSPARAREALAELSGTGRAALADMRRVLGALRDPDGVAEPGAPLDPQPGSVDLGRLVEGFRTAGVPVRWTSTGPPLPPEAGVQLAVYRIVQESLTNVLRHAPATTRVDVVVASAPGRVEITVTDAGPAPGDTLVPTPGSGRGLIGMRERASVYGGRVEAGPARRRLAGARGADVGRGAAVTDAGMPGVGQHGPVRVLLVDDQALLRMGFRLVLEGEDDLEVVGEAGDGDAAVRQATALRPDVVLMDVRMPGTNGIEATARVVAAVPGCRVLILTTFDLDEYAFAALRAGASGFLLKDARPAELVAAIRAVATGDAVVSPRVTRRMLEMFAGELPAAGAPEPGPRGVDARLATLTARETEILRAVAEGLSNAEVAARFVLSEATVKTHVGRVLAKLDVRDRVQAVVLAYETGLVTPG